MHDVLTLGQVLHADEAGVQPLGVGLGARERGLDLLVADDATVLGVDEEHLAGLQAPALHHVGGVELDDARLGGEHDEPVVGHGIPARAQPVAVEHGPDEGAVGEADVGRAVPRLHEGGVELVERLAGGVHRGVVLPRLGDHHEHRVRQRAASEVQQLEHLVEAGGVGGVGGADREDPLEVTRDDVGGQLALTGAHPVAVALDGVDLAVVGDHPVGVRERPRRERVGREARVHERELGGETRVREVGEERLELAGREHPLVDDRARAERGEVDLGLALGPLAQAEGEPVEPEGDLATHRAADEELLEERHALAGDLADEVGADRHLAPAEHLEVLGGSDLLDAGLGGGALDRVGGQEGHPRGIRPDVGQRERHGLAEELVGDLREDARAVTDERVGARGAAVVEVAQGRQGVVEDVVPGAPAHRRDERDAAGIVLELAAVEAGVLRLCAEEGAGVRRHLHRPSDWAPGLPSRGRRHDEWHVDGTGHRRWVRRYRSMPSSYLLIRRIPDAETSCSTGGRALHDPGRQVPCDGSCFEPACVASASRSSAASAEGSPSGSRLRRSAQPPAPRLGSARGVRRRLRRRPPERRTPGRRAR